MSRDANNGHTLYTKDDFTLEESEKRGALYVHVVESGLGICKVCGAGEIELSISCADFQQGTRMQ